ncbi:hypothetical protein MUG87_02315 [Ectobacillus sp. JY-23]|uniref:hypothetical protein n=1 Tax=Ectobacillus sp. JY-23 TaxID=2933872 RepID=UPI001FF52DE2|nr:hypothetical protein [Ectobacillus sp. JY-23]UOY92993.1 hypothetical protein MUG87_02315 [Ectobacillus sp. JY-23]
MIHLKAKEAYLKQLQKELHKHTELETILFDYDVHLSEIILEESDKETVEEWMICFTNRIGSPKEVADLWREELSVTHHTTLLHFFLLNVCFFLLGGFFTFLHLFHQAQWLQHIWNILTAIPTMIMVLYMLFWGLLGYEIGKSFGAEGKQLMRKTFAISLLPNLTLMLLVLFRVIPHEWFHPLLSRTFIILCIAATALLYPICCVGYYFGKNQSI